ALRLARRRRRSLPPLRGHRPRPRRAGREHLDDRGRPRPAVRRQRVRQPVGVAGARLADPPRVHDLQARRHRSDRRPDGLHEHSLRRDLRDLTTAFAPGGGVLGTPDAVKLVPLAPLGSIVSTARPHLLVNRRIPCARRLVRRLLYAPANRRTRGTCVHSSADRSSLLSSSPPAPGPTIPNRARATPPTRAACRTWRPAWSAIRRSPWSRTGCRREARRRCRCARCPTRSARCPPRERRSASAFSPTTTAWRASTSTTSTPASGRVRSRSPARTMPARR